MLYRFENFSFDDSRGVIIKEKKEFKLTKTQNKLLQYFVTHPSQITSKQELMDKVWGRIVTENSVDQIISILRNHLELIPSKPQLIVTHYGQGLSFEGKIQADFPEKIEQSDDSQIQKKSFPKVWLLFIIALAISLFVYQYNNTSKIVPTKIVAEKDKKLLILPMTFSDKSIDDVAKKGMKSLIKTTFNNLESEGDLIFDESSFTTQQAVEKHWKIEDELVVVQADVVKNGDIYEATVELSNGINYNETKTLSAPSLEILLDKQVDLIAQMQNAKPVIKDPINSLYVRALGERKSGHLNKAKQLLEQLLSQREDHHQGRLLLAEVLISLKQYDEALSQLSTLKATEAYQNYSTEIELKLAEIKLQKNQYQQVIDDLKKYQVSNLSINKVKKAKIQLLIGQAYSTMGNPKSAITAFKQAIANIDELINPAIYAQSYFGQADMLSKKANDNKVYSTFSLAYDYAKSAADLHLQIRILNAMAKNRLLQNQWEKSVALTQKAIKLMELTNNKEEIARALGNLTATLNLRGKISQARLVNNRLGKIAQELDSDNLRLYFLYYEAALDMNQYKYSRAQEQIDKQFALAKKINNYSMLLNNGFIQMELLLLKEDTEHFKQAWDERSALIKENGFERFQVYMDLFLGRYYKQLHEDKKAIEILTKVSEEVKAQNDMKVYTDAQNQLAEVYLRSDPIKSLSILNNLEQYNPHPNPYLDLKAAALHKLGKNIEALSVINKAKLIYNEGWTAKNQKLLETIQMQLK